MIYTEIGDIPLMKYGAIYLDNPWKYSMYSEKGHGKSPEAHYRTMTNDEILALPIRDMAARDCMLFMWAVWPRLPFALECIKVYGFEYVTGGAWWKRTKTGKLRWGPGYVVRSVCEPFLIARTGRPQAKLTDIPNGFGVEQIDPAEIGSISIEGLARDHSRKPNEVRDVIERMTPGQFRLEMFAREEWPGNDVFGNEVAVGGALAAAV